MQVVHSARHRGHAPTVETYLGLPESANEVPERAEIIAAALAADGGFEIAEPAEHGEAPILAVHDAGLLRFVEEAWAVTDGQRLDREFLVADTYPVRAMFEGMSEGLAAARPEPLAAGGRAGWWGLDSGNPITPGTYDAARAAVDVALSTVDLVLGGERVAYGLCRPPGHHAGRSMAGGYCFFNNAAIAAQAIVGATGERVAILDVDVHHGNGTQQIFWRRGDVLYASLHVDPRARYPFFLGHADEVGEGLGEGENLNVPLPEGTADGAYLEALDRTLEVIAARPGSVLVVSLGFDTYEHDPIGGLAVSTPAYHEMGRRIASLGRRLVILQEGGYHRPSLGENARAWLRGAEGRAHEPGSWAAGDTIEQR